MGFPNPFRRYPVSVVIFEKRGENSVQLVKDKACRKKNRDGLEVYHLKKKNTDIRPPPYKFIYLGKKGKPILMLYSVEAGNFIPLQFNDPSWLEPAVSDKEVNFWNILQIKKSHEIYPKDRSWLEKYLPLAMVLIVAVTLIFVTMFVMEGMVKISGDVGSITSALDGISKQLTGWTPTAPGT